jgi:methylated-DNA-protein-cysteine methyltransferase related protein
LLGQTRAARTVGWALRAAHTPDDVPWHRVVNGSGRISLRAGYGAELQRALLEDEGVEFDLSGRIDLGRFGYVCTIDRSRP